MLGLARSASHVSSFVYRFLATLHLAFVTIFVYHYTVVHYGDVTALLIPTWYVSASSKYEHY